MAIVRSSRSGREVDLSSALAAAIGLVLLPSVIAACLLRPAWGDEFFTFYVAQPEFSWAEGLQRHWLTDNHPPLYYAMVRATSWLGDTVEARRLVNVAVLSAGATMLWGLAARYPLWRRTLAIYTMGLAAAPVTLFYGSELRSNFLAFATASVACAALTVLTDTRSRSLSWRRTASLMFALMLAFNTHYISTVFTGAFATGFIGKLLVERRIVAAKRLFIACAAAALPLLVTFAAQASSIARNTEDFWISSGLNAARWAIEKQVHELLLANPVLTIMGAAGICILIRATLPSRQLGQALATVATLCISTLLALVILVVIHLWKPIVTERYLIALGPPALLALSIGFDRIVELLHQRGRSEIAALLLLCLAGATLVTMGGTWRTAMNEPSWGGTARAIAKLQRDCPHTVVHVDTHWNRLELPPADKRYAMPMAYRMTARQFGFRVEPQASRTMARDCPTVFWSEHVHEVDATPSDVATSLAARGFSLGRFRLEHIGRGWIAISDPHQEALD